MTTTVAEAVNRADLIVVAGPGARAFVEDRKLFAKASTPYGWRGKRSVLALGCEAPTTVSECETTRAIAGDPLDLLRELKAEVGNKPSAATHQTAVQMLKDARFGVVVVDPNDFDRFGFELMMALVKELNETTRFTSISAPAAAHGRGANLVSLWTTGGRLRVGFGRGYPEQDDWRFNGERLAESGEADLLIWVGALAPDLPAYASKLTTIALVPPGTKATADVVIEVGVPGVHHAGSLTDAIRDGFSFVEAGETDVHPTVADVLDAFSAALATRKGAA
ncbi:Formyltransferase/hydrolase complex Fhc subunit B [Hartmannibacter diazotrophicus]|uniref:Formyltransferase/hydrolase complex Fhc subunit B n=2 Tax=Hartmannibacter diazotrophicus TaxID=1482074 RepID=A0A2C9D6B2_9HYPH|nr:Formyltransferase/hydrolase complex Fhc subunit B [Hartmannibacter diazotrophicus]